MKKYYRVSEVKSSFLGIPNLPQKETLTLDDILSSLPSLFTRTPYEADAYEVSFMGYFKTYGLLEVKEDHTFRLTPTGIYAYYGLFKINEHQILICFRASSSAVVFLVNGENCNENKGCVLEKHTLIGKSGIMVKRSILAF